VDESALNFLRKGNDCAAIPSSKVTTRTPERPEQFISVNEREDQKVLVVGGGPAGLAAAIAVRAAGYRVTLVERAHPPVDKACGEGILPDGIAVLRRMGIRIPTGEGFAIRGVRFISDDVSVEGEFPSGYGLGLRRTRLHEILIEHATRTGVRVLWGPSRGKPADTAGFRWVIGADGLRSRTRCAAGLDSTRRECFRFGFRRHHRLAPWTDFVEVYWGDDCQVYVTPVGSDQVGVALLTRNPRLRLDSAIGAFPVLQRRLAGATAITLERGGLTVSRRLDRVVQGKVLLIGDASGSVDAVTGDGLSLAFRQSLALAEALLARDPARYESAHRALIRRPALVAWLLLRMDHFPAVRRVIMRILAGCPGLFANLLALHTAPPEGAWRVGSPR